MTPKEKAFEIYENIYRRTPLVLTEAHRHVSARTISIYMVNEILNCCIGSHEEYWREVKQQIKNI